MITCHRFGVIKSDYEQEIRCLSGYARTHQGTPAAKTAARTALGTKQRMAKALVRHYERCRECG